MTERELKNTWVEIGGIVLQKDERAPNLPDDTKQVPLEMRVKGFLLHDAEKVREADIVTLSGRTVRGTRLFVKDEAANPSGSFKDRRASLSAFEAKKKGYKGIAAATSGNYGAAVASQAAKAGLGCIIVQEAFDSHGIAQPEIAEKTRHGRRIRDGCRIRQGNQGEACGELYCRQNDG